VQTSWSHMSKFFRVPNSPPPPLRLEHPILTISEPCPTLQMQGLWFVKPWLARILLRLTLFCTASLVILLCLWIKMLLPTVHLSSELDQKIFSIPCYMTIQLCLRKDIAAFAFDVGFIWWGMSYMVIGEVTLGCTEYQMRSHNVSLKTDLIEH